MKRASEKEREREREGGKIFCLDLIKVNTDIYYLMSQVLLSTVFDGYIFIVKKITITLLCNNKCKLLVFSSSYPYLNYKRHTDLLLMSIDTATDIIIQTKFEECTKCTTICNIRVIIIFNNYSYYQRWVERFEVRKSNL